MAGVYSYLPLGMRVIENIKQVVREEMDAIGTRELLMSSMQRKEIWEQTNRWDEKIVDVWFKAKLNAGGEVGFGWSHEEPIGEMMKNYIHSYKDLPIFVYQFQNKLRNELRAKSGIMRGREFLMKDAYSFSTDEEEHEKYYQASIDAYKKVFDRLGLGEDTFVTYADGGAFTEFSHEFQTICEAGEDKVYVNKDRSIAINEEIATDEKLKDLGVKKDELELVTTAEVGNIFNFGTQKAEDLGLFYMNEKEEKIPVHMGSYGIGISRLLGVLVEKFSDEKGIVLPESVAPFKVHLIQVGNDEKVSEHAKDVYETLRSQGVEVLFDDRDVRPGQKFKDSELIGIPTRAVVSVKTMAEGKVEVTKRESGTTKMVDEAEFMNP
jgi:prolyl-tRNA synthetase